MIFVNIIWMFSQHGVFQKLAFECSHNIWFFKNRYQAPTFDKVTLQMSLGALHVSSCGSSICVPSQSIKIAASTNVISYIFSRNKTVTFWAIIYFLSVFNNNAPVPWVPITHRCVLTIGISIVSGSVGDSVKQKATQIDYLQRVNLISPIGKWRWSLMRSTIFHNLYYSYSMSI